MIDFGSHSNVNWTHLTSTSLFHNVPSQFRKCQLLNVKFTAENDAQRQKVRKSIGDLILNEKCRIYIHENLDPLLPDTIFCTIQQFNKQLDLTSILIKQGHVKCTSASYIKREEAFDWEKRTRKESDTVILKPSCEFNTRDDLEQFYEAKKTVVVRSNPVDLNDRKYEVFDLQKKRVSFDNNGVNVIIPLIHAEEISHLIIDRITKHYSLLQLDEPEFLCKPIYVIDPNTVLVVPENAITPFVEAAKHTKLMQFLGW